MLCNCHRYIAVYIALQNQINFSLFDRKVAPQLTQMQQWFTECYSVVEKHKKDVRKLTVKNRSGKNN